MDEKVKDFLEKLKRRGFKQDLGLISLCRTSYAGGSAYINSGNLFTHARERAEEYRDRLQRAYYLNYCSPIIDTYSFFLYKAPVIRNTADQNIRLLTFLADCDRKMKSFDDFLKDTCLEVLTVGRAFIAVDVPDVETMTLLEDFENKKRPYLYRINTEDVLDFEEDDNGLVWIKYLETRPAKNGNPFYDGEGETQVIVIWYRGKYEVYEQEKGTLIESKELEIDFVPIVKLEMPGGKSMIADIARVNRAIFNWGSLLDEILYRQTFSWLCVPGDKNESLAEKKIGTAWAFTYDPDSKHVPQFVAPDPNQAETYEKRIKNGVAEIYRIANLDYSQATQPQSGVSKAYDLLSISKTLIALAKTMAGGEKQIFKYVAKYYGQDINPSDAKLESDFDVYIEYPSDFSYTAVAERLQRYYEALTTQFSAKFKKLAAMQIVNTLFPALPEKTKEVIKTEIESFYDEQQIVNDSNVLASLGFNADEYDEAGGGEPMQQEADTKQTEESLSK